MQNINDIIQREQAKIVAEAKQKAVTLAKESEAAEAAYKLKVSAGDASELELKKSAEVVKAVKAEAARFEGIVEKIVAAEKGQEKNEAPAAPKKEEAKAEATASAPREEEKKATPAAKEEEVKDETTAPAPKEEEKKATPAATKEEEVKDETTASAARKEEKKVVEEDNDDTGPFDYEVIDPDAAEKAAAKETAEKAAASAASTGAATSTVPADITVTVPADVTVTVPADATVTVPTDATVTVPTDATVTVPTDATVTVPTDATVTVPADATVIVPTDATVTVPADITVTVPTDATVTVPADATVTVPADATVIVPTDATVTVPTDAIVTVPTDATVIVPADATVTVPTDAIVTVPTDATVTVPADIAVPAEVITLTDLQKQALDYAFYAHKYAKLAKSFEELNKVLPTDVAQKLTDLPALNDNGVSSKSAIELREYVSTKSGLFGNTEPCKSDEGYNGRKFEVICEDVDTNAKGFPVSSANDVGNWAQFSARAVVEYSNLASSVMTALTEVLPGDLTQSQDALCSLNLSDDITATEAYKVICSGKSIDDLVA
jgi:hypothetical protein